MTDRMQLGLEHEKRIASMFSKAGWDCDYSQPNREFDITLKKNDMIYGYVETYIMGNPRTFERVVKRVQLALDKIKPKLFVLTDGNSFEIYLDGKYFKTTNIPIEYDDYTRINRIMAYSRLLKGNNNGEE